MQHLEGKVAVVTGGASGMGLAMARAFLRAGMRVAVLDVEDAALAAVRQAFAGTNGLLALKVDVTDRAAMARAADEIEHAFGKVHVLCNNAGVSVGGTVDSMTYRDWDWVLGVNLHGVINGLQTFLPRMKAHGEGGHIVNTASMAGQVPVPGLSVYCATKYAVVGISETIRAELAPLGIGVSVLCPGVVDTRIFESGRNRPYDLVDEGAVDASVFRRTDEAYAPVDAARPARGTMTAPIADALDPAIVGEMVVEAIRADDAYIFTHPGMRSEVAARFARLETGFDRWRARAASDVG